MMKKRKWIAVLLLFVMIFQWTSCAKKDPTDKEDKEVQTEIKTEALEDISAEEGESMSEIDTKVLENVPTDFAVRLFQASQNGKNVLLSPISVFLALSMTANGAEGETLSQMETVLGLSAEKLNRYAHFLQNPPQEEKAKLAVANSVWFRRAERFTVNQNFLQTNQNFYDAEIFEEDFTPQTCKKMNRWVKEKTNQMIPEILDDISQDTVMLLINAAAFEAEWEKTYESSQVRQNVFTSEDGKTQDIEMMLDRENQYLESEQATGFLKYYKNGKYAFAALLPKEGISVSELVNSFNGENLHALLSQPRQEMVDTAIPKFEVEYENELSAILKTMGMPDAFNDLKADFSSLGSSTVGNIYINRVLHKTFISVGEKGTKAGAVTAVEANDAAAPPEQPKEVILDRPFVYMLVDCEHYLPYFIGSLMEIPE